MACESVHTDNWPHTRNQNEKETPFQDPRSLISSITGQNLNENHLLRTVGGSTVKPLENKQKESSSNNLRHLICDSNLSSQATCVKQLLNQNSNSNSEFHSSERTSQENKPSLLTNSCLRQSPSDNEPLGEIIRTTLTADQQCTHSMSLEQINRKQHGSEQEKGFKVLERGVTPEETCLKQSPAENTQLKQTSTSISHVGCPLINTNTYRRERSPEINCTEKLYQENNFLGETTLLETGHKQMPLENRTILSTRDGNLMQRSSRKNDDKEAVMDVTCPIKTYSENKCIHEALVGRNCPRQMSVENQAISTKLDVKQNVSENNSSSEAASRNRDMGSMPLGICSFGDKFLKNELPCVTSVVPHEHLRDSSLQNKHSNCFIDAR